MIWAEPQQHPADCYFCQMEKSRAGYRRKTKSKIEYPNVNSAKKPVPTTDSTQEEIPVVVSTKYLNSGEFLMKKDSESCL